MARTSRQQQKAIHAQKQAGRIGRLFAKHDVIPASKQDIAKGNFHIKEIHSRKGEGFPLSTSLVVKGKK